MWEDYISGSFLSAAADSERRVRISMKDIAAGRSAQPWNWDVWVRTESSDTLMTGTGWSPDWNRTDIKSKMQLRIIVERDSYISVLSSEDRENSKG